MGGGGGSGDREGMGRPVRDEGVGKGSGLRDGSTGEGMGRKGGRRKGGRGREEGSGVREGGGRKRGGKGGGAGDVEAVSRGPLFGSCVVVIFSLPLPRDLWAMLTFLSALLMTSVLCS